MAKIEPVGQRYSFEVLVKSVTLTLPGSIKIFIILSYDHKKLEGKSHLQIDKMNTVANFNETFELATVLYKIQGKEEFREKKAKIGIYAVAQSNKVKVLGECLLSLSTLAIDKSLQTKTYKFQNCIDKNAAIELEVKAKFVEILSATSSPDTKNAELIASPKSSRDMDKDKDPEPSPSNEADSGKKSISFTSQEDVKRNPEKPHKFALKFSRQGPSRVQLKPNEDKETKEKEEWADKYKNLQQTLEKTQNEAKIQLEKLKAENSNLVKAQTELEREKQNNLEKLKQCQEEIKVLSKGKNDVKQNDIEKYKITNEDLNTKIKNLKDENTKIKTENKENVKLLEEHKQKLASKDKSLEKIQKENEQFALKAKELETKLEDSKKENSLLTTTLGKSKEMHNKEINDLTAKLSTMEGECKKSVLEQNLLRQTIDTLKGSMEKNDFKSNAQDKILNEYKIQSESIINDLKKQLKEKDEVNKQTETKLNETTMKIQEIEQTHKKEVDKINGLLGKSKIGMNILNYRMGK